MRGVVSMTTPLLDPSAPRHLLGIGEPDDLVEGILAGIDLFDCAVPTRLARHGMALAPLPEARYRFDVRRARHAEDDAPLVEGCPCPTCGVHTRAYVHYLSRAEEMTGVRLLATHNLSYLERLVRGAREAIQAGALATYRERTLGGAPPWRALTEYGSR
jgi:queuine tRNA-ribosyltransferase